MKIIARNIKDTEKLGKIIAGCIDKGTVICLDGELGAGKTALTRFIAREFGVKENIVSPTFTIIKEYEGKLPFYHMDVYRIDSEDDMSVSYTHLDVYKRQALCLSNGNDSYIFIDT